MLLFNFLALVPLSPVFVGIGMLAVVIFTAKNNRENTTISEDTDAPKVEMVSSKPSAPATDTFTVTATTTQDFLTEDIVTLFEKKQIFLRQGLRIDDIARECTSNRTYVSNCINNYYGQSFSTLVNSFRVNYAKDLILANGGMMKLSVVCERSGFSDEVSFIRNFKKFTGMTPSEWCASNMSRHFAS